MEFQNIESFSKLLQMSMLPVVLISAVGLLMLSITNRLGRTVDRSRSLAQELESSGGESKEQIRAQLHILLRRSSYLRTSASFLAGSIFLSSLMVVSLFLLLFVGWQVQALILSLFFLSVAAIALSMIFFLIDTSLALRAVRLDVQPHL